MKVANVTLPLAGLLFLSGNGIALAGSSSMLDPYAYIQAPTRAEREQQQQKKTKKFKVRHLKASPSKAAQDFEPLAKAAPKPATVILSTEMPKAPARGAEKVKNNNSEKAPVKEASADTSLSTGEHGSGFLEGIKQSTDGIAKSTKAVGSSVINGSKSVGSKIAGGFKCAGEKVKDAAVASEKVAVVPKKIGEGILSTGEKVKEGGSSVGAKVASGFKSAGGSLAAIPKAVGSVAGKVGGGTQEGAKKIAAAPVAGLGAIGHGISKMNPFHKDETPEAVAQKPKDKNESPEAVAQNAKGQNEAAEAVAQKPEGEKIVPSENVGSDKTASAKDNAPVAEKVAETRADAGAKPEEVANKTAEASTTTDKAAALDDKTALAQKDSNGIKKKLASAPRASIEAGLAGLNATKAGVGVISHGINRLNPFHKSNKVEVPAQATAEKPKEPEKPKQDSAPAVDPPQTQLGDRITIPENETAGNPAGSETNADSTAAGPGAVPQ
jgi:hypothetical protein